MPITTSETVNVRIEFEITDGVHTLRDALTYTPEEYALLTPVQIEGEKSMRFANWVDLIENPPPATELDTTEVV